MNLSSGMAASAYRRAAAAVHPTVAVVKLYDEVILAIVQAIKAFESKSHETAFKKVLRAAAILRGLDHSLDHAVGGDVAARLHRVYVSYILALHVNYGKPDVTARYGKLLVGLTELRDSWASIAGVRARADLGPPVDPAAHSAPLVPSPRVMLGRDEIDLTQLALVCRQGPGARPAPPPKAPAPRAAPAPAPASRLAGTRIPVKRSEAPKGKPR